MSGSRIRPGAPATVDEGPGDGAAPRQQALPLALVPRDGGDGAEPAGLYDLPPPPPVGEGAWLERIAEAATGDHALELLVGLLRSGEIDPWDVDIRLVADRFLAAVDALKPEDLPKSGRLLFFASVIIRLKAQVLAGRGSDLLASEGGDDDLIDGSEPIFDPEGLGAGLRRLEAGEILLMPRDRLRKRRPLTIQDLFDALRMSEAHEQKMLELRADKRARGVVVPFKSVREAMETLHKDDLEGDIKRASKVVQEAFGRGEVLPLGAFGPQLDEVSAFLALLFLEARGEVELTQDEFYGPVMVAPPRTGAAVRTGSPEA